MRFQIGYAVSASWFLGMLPIAFAILGYEFVILMSPDSDLLEFLPVPLGLLSALTVSWRLRIAYGFLMAAIIFAAAYAYTEYLEWWWFAIYEVAALVMACLITMYERRRDSSVHFGSRLAWEALLYQGVFMGASIEFLAKDFGGHLLAVVVAGAVSIIVLAIGEYAQTKVS